MSEMCETCQNYACLGSWEVGYQLTTGHHPHCPDRGRIGANSSDIIDKLVTLYAKGTEESARLTAERDNFREVIRRTLDDHITLAGQYEAGGNTRGSIQLRAVANLLGAILRGDTPSTVCPPVETATHEACDSCQDDKAEWHTIVIDNDGEID